MQCEMVEGGLKGNKLILQTLKKMWAGGIPSFYRGLPLGVIGVFPYRYNLEYCPRTGFIMLTCSVRLTWERLSC